MPVYEYIARDPSGNRIRGKLESESRSKVLDELIKQRIVPTSVKEARSLRDFLPAFPGKSVKTGELIMFTRQLLTMMKAGINLLSCLHSLRVQVKNPVLKSAIERMHADVREGSSLSEAMSRHGSIFSDVYVSTIRVGEEGGVLDEVLDRLVGLLEHEAETRSAMKQAIRYPIIVLVALVITFAVAVLFILPKFSQLFTKFEAELPLPTRILLGINSAVHENGVTMLIVMIVVGYAGYSILRSRAGKKYWDELKLKIPVVGPLFVQIAISRFARMFSTLDRCGLPILRNLEIVAETVGNIVIAREIMRQRESVRKGGSIAEPLAESRYFPPLVSEMLSIGEASGSMDESLSAVADHYDREVQYTLKNMATLIEPLITLIMGAFVLFMAVAIFLPMWKMTSIIQK